MPSNEMISISSRVAEVSDFVKEAMDTPTPDDFDWWLEGVPAALFSSSFEVFVMIAYAETRSEQDFEKLLHQFTKELAIKASVWVEERCSKTLPSTLQGKVKIKEGTFQPRIEHRLNSYFGVALRAMADRNYDIEFARSHSCFVMLSKVIEELVKVDTSVSPKQAAAFLENMMDLCKSLAKDIHGELQKLLKRHGG